MTERGSRRVARTSLCLLTVLVLSCATNGIDRANAYPIEPLNFYGNSAEEAENTMLVDRLNQLMEQKQQVVEQEHEINNEQIEIEAILGAKAREQKRSMEYLVGESKLPLDKNVEFHLCPFKVCTNGRRKKQSK